MTESKSMKIKLIESFGLKDLLIANFVYRPPKRGTSINNYFFFRLCV
jgi:hypothetical protein